MSMFYRGDHRLRLRRAIWFHDGIRPAFDPRGNFVRYDAVRRWEVTFDRGERSATAINKSFTWAVVRSILLVYREVFLPRWAEAAHQHRLRRNLEAIREDLGHER